MALLFEIPTEIIHQIISLLPTADLTSLCLTNQSIRYHAEPCLYSTIDFKWFSHKKPPIIFLLRTLLYRPELFALVHTFSLVGYAFRHEIGLREAVPKTQDELRLDIPSNISLAQFISAIKKTEASYTDVWVERLKAGHMDAFAGLLIAYLSDTISLTITTNFIRDFTLIGKILQSKALQQKACSDQIPKFTQLQRLAYIRRLDQDQEDHDDRFGEAISTFYLPTLIDIKLWIANPSEFQWPVREPSLDHLTSLDIEWLDPELLTRILSLTQNLKSLTYSWDYIDAIDDAWKIPNLDLDEIITALSPIKYTLEKLHIQFRIGFGLKDTWPEISVSGSFNLTNFDRIKELYVPFAALSGFGPDFTPLSYHIPPSVETLSLTLDMMEDPSFEWPLSRPDMKDWGEDIKAWGEGILHWSPENTFQSLILLLAESCPTKFPRLKQILWFVRMVEDDYIIFEREAEKLSPLLGVVIKVLNNNRDLYYRYDGP